MNHTCHALRCNVITPENLFMCKKHWYMLPRSMRLAVWAVYVPGQETTKTPTLEYVDVALKAVTYLAEKEGFLSSGASVRETTL